MNYVEEDYIETVSGVAFHFLNPSPDEIRIEDIASSLSKQCRYTGHVHTFYSVAEHCCHLHDYLHANTSWANIEEASKDLRTILLHDASEAYLVDVARPIKKHIPDYKNLEAKIEAAIAEKFDLHYPYPAWLKEYDTRILLDERRQAMNPSKNTWAVEGMKPLGVTLEFWNPPHAFVEFCERFEVHG